MNYFWGKLTHFRAGSPPALLFWRLTLMFTFIPNLLIMQRDHGRNWKKPSNLLIYVDKWCWIDFSSYRHRIQQPEVRFRFSDKVALRCIFVKWESQRVRLSVLRWRGHTLFCDTTVRRLGVYEMDGTERKVCMCH